MPTPPGGGTDITGRKLAEQAEMILGQKIVVVNKPGASGSLGLSLLTQVKPDGYTLAYVWNAPLTIVPHSLDVTYKTEDLTPITQASHRAKYPWRRCDCPDARVSSARRRPVRCTHHVSLCSW